MPAPWGRGRAVAPKRRLRAPDWSGARALSRRRSAPLDGDHATAAARDRCRAASPPPRGSARTRAAATSAPIDSWRVPPGPTTGATRQLSIGARSEEHTSELQSLRHLVCRLLLEKKKKL